jgi:hypothetical protein
MECAKPACTNDCPVGVKVNDFVQLIVAGDFLGAAAKIREDNVLPAITGRVCPQEDHCEGGCLMGKKVSRSGSAIWSASSPTTSSAWMSAPRRGSSDREEGCHRRQWSLRANGGG